MTPPPVPADRAVARPLPPLAAAAAWTLAGALVATFLRLWHGSWTMVGQALLAPLIFIPFVLGLWVWEQLRERPAPLWAAVSTGIGGGAFAGLASSIFLPALGPVRANVIAGMIWGTVIALGWVRRGRNDAPSPARLPESGA